METKVDNFDLIKTLLNFDIKCFYFLQILQRKKENPQIGSNSNVIATYYIKSVEHLERLRPEIIMLCKLYNARAYINLNKRIQEELCLPMIKKLVFHMENKDFSTIHRVFNSVCGDYNKSKDKIWIIDIDKDTPESINTIVEFIDDLPPEGYKFIATIPTVSGKHLLTTPFNSEKFKKQFPHIDIQKNNPTILYYEKQLKLLVLQGIPASGKSTFAKEYIKDKPDWVIVSRDEIRESTGTYWVPERENYITVLENNAILEAFNHNLNVIIDATNLNPKTIDKWKDLSKKHNIELEFKYFEISLEEALQRDQNRKEKGLRSVGDKVLRDFYIKYVNKNPFKEIKQSKLQYNVKEYLQQDITLPKAVIVDIDGTVALMNGRNAFDWNKVNTDLPNQPVIDIIHSLHPNIKIIFLSGREGTEECKKQTTEWINKYFDLPSNYELYMRNANDYRGDEIIKREIFNSHIYNQYNIIGVFDDRNKVVNMWRKIGLLCLQVEQGDF